MKNIGTAGVKQTHSGYLEILARYKVKPTGLSHQARIYPIWPVVLKRLESWRSDINAVGWDPPTAVQPPHLPARCWSWHHHHCYVMNKRSKTIKEKKDWCSKFTLVITWLCALIKRVTQSTICQEYCKVRTSNIRNGASGQMCRVQCAIDGFSILKDIPNHISSSDAMIPFDFSSLTSETKT